MVLYGFVLQFLHFDIFIWFNSGDTDYAITVKVVVVVMSAALVTLVVVVMIVVMFVSHVVMDLVCFLLMFGIYLFHFD